MILWCRYYMRLVWAATLLAGVYLAAKRLVSTYPDVSPWLFASFVALVGLRFLRTLANYLWWPERLRP